MRVCLPLNHKLAAFRCWLRVTQCRLAMKSECKSTHTHKLLIRVAQANYYKRTLRTNTHATCTQYGATERCNASGLTYHVDARMCVSFDKSNADLLL